MNTKTPTHKQESETEQIGEIIETIITNDSLNVFKKDRNSEFLLGSLVRIKIFNPKKVKREPNDLLIPPLPPLNLNEAYLHELLEMHTVNKPLFKDQDKNYIVSQNLKQKTLPINISFLNQINLFSKDNQKTNNYCVLSIPIFSKEKEAAYVQLTYYYKTKPTLCKVYFLQKKSRQWYIIENYVKWRSN